MFPIRPSLSPARRAERHRRDAELCERYPGHDVAYVDTWDGDRLTREVVAAAPDPVEFQARLSALAPEVRSRAHLTHVPDPDGLFIPSIDLA